MIRENSRPLFVDPGYYSTTQCFSRVWERQRLVLLGMMESCLSALSGRVGGPRLVYWGRGLCFSNADGFSVGRFSRDTLRPGDDKIVVPDENEEEHVHKVWFEEFPHGCGNCGNESHTFTSCPLRNPTTVTIKITIPKPSSLKENPESDAQSHSHRTETWTNVTKTSKVSATPSPTPIMKPELLKKVLLLLSTKLNPLPQNPRTVKYQPPLPPTLKSIQQMLLLLLLLLLLRAPMMEA